MSRWLRASEHKPGAEPEPPAMVEPRPGRPRRGLKRIAAILGLAGVRTVNAWFYQTPLDVFVERTVLMILMAYAITEWQARRAKWLRHTRAAATAAPSRQE